VYEAFSYLSKQVLALLFVPSLQSGSDSFYLSRVDLI